jgi:tetratricopeptide (TPR) repeat protein
VSRWASARLGEIERRGTWIPIRAHFGVRALGVNAYVGAEAGEPVIGEHVEDWRGHEELYLVLEGHATFTVEGDEIDAPARTLVYVRDPNAKRGAVANEPGTTILAAGGKPGEAFVPSGWERGWTYVERANEQAAAGRYAEAAGVMREGLEEIPEHSGFRYNLACYAALAGDRDAAFEALRQAVEEYPRFTELARDEPDFASIRSDPRFAAIAE